MESKAKNKNRNKVVLAFDTLMFTGFLVTSVPALEGKTLHEWFGIVCAVLAVTHLLINWRWLVAVIRNLFRSMHLQTRIGALLNAALFVDVTVLIFTGLMISEVVLRTLGIELPRSQTWKQVHILSSDAFLTLVWLHIALHAQWIWMTIKRMVGRVTMPRLAAAHIEEVRS
jgi:hypothetical protein